MNGPWWCNGRAARLGVALVVGAVAALVVANGIVVSAGAVTPSPSVTVGPTGSNGPSESPSLNPSESAAAPSASGPTEGTPTATPTAQPSASPSASILDQATPSPSAPANRPATNPAVRSSGIALGTALSAAVVLLLAAIGLWLLYRRSTDGGPRPGTESTSEHLPPAPQPPAPAPSIPPTREPALLEFLVALGEAMVDSGDPVTHVSASLGRVARMNGAHDAEIIVLSTALIVSLPSARSVQTSVATAGSRRLRLDQIDAVFRVVSLAEHGNIDAADGLASLAAARALPPPIGPGVRIVGYTVLTVGIALILRAGWTDLVVAAILGAAVGTIQLLAARLSVTYTVLLPVGCAFGVSLTVFLLGRTGLDVGVFAPLVAPLVTFLPGALLTTAVVELATGQMISGAGRLAAGVMQLVLLSLGIVAAAQLVGVPATRIVDVAAKELSPLAPWIGVAIFGIGVVLHDCARRASAGWILLVLYVAYAGQILGGLFFGGVLSAFVGALVMTPVARFVATQPTGPPTLVSFLPAFWLLVPGALGLVGATKFLGENRVDGASALVTAGATMVGIALGVLLGQGLATVRRGEGEGDGGSVGH